MQQTGAGCQQHQPVSKEITDESWMCREQAGASTPRSGHDRGRRDGIRGWPARQGPWYASGETAQTHRKARPTSNPALTAEAEAADDAAFTQHSTSGRSLQGPTVRAKIADVAAAPGPRARKLKQIEIRGHEPASSLLHRAHQRVKHGLHLE